VIPARAQPNKRKLTPLLVQRLRSQARAYLVWDTVQRGLALRVEPTGYMGLQGRLPPPQKATKKRNVIGQAELMSSANHAMSRLKQRKYTK
jgi:hypothetical protein